MSVTDLRTEDWRQQIAEGEAINNLAHDELQWKRQRHSNSLTLQSKTCGILLKLLKSSQRPVLSVFVAVHEGVLQQSMLQGTVQGLPMQFRWSKLRPPGSSTSRISWQCSHRCQTAQGPLIVPPWACVLKSFIIDQNSPPEKLLLYRTMITPHATTRARQVTMGKMSIPLDRWYMACNRTIMITYMIHSLVSRFHCDTATE